MPSHLLGVIDTRVGRSFWLSQAETFLEAAIRAAPSSDIARESYDLLEEYLVAGYTGSAGRKHPRRCEGASREPAGAAPRSRRSRALSPVQESLWPRRSRRR